MRHDFLAAQEDALEVEVDDLVPGLLAEDGEVGRLSMRADYSPGVVDEDVDLAEGSDRGRYHLLHLRAAGDVAQAHQPFAARRLDETQRLLGLRHADVGDGDLGAFFREALAYRPAHTFGTAGNYRYLTL